MFKIFDVDEPVTGEIHMPDHPNYLYRQTNQLDYSL